MTFTRKQYYNDTSIKFNIIHQLKHRETCFIPYDLETTKSQKPIRWLNASCLDFLYGRIETKDKPALEGHFNKFNFLDRKMNLYFSLTTYTNFPTFSYIYNIKAQQQKLWLEKFQDYVHKYDFFIETDSSGDFQQAWNDTKKIKEIFDDFKIRYYIKFSGSKGFHILVDYDDFDHLRFDVYNKDKQDKHYNTFIKNFPNEFNEIRNMCDLVMLFKIMVVRIKYMFSLDTIDSGISDIKRVCKVAYSYDVKSNLIAYPLSDKQFETFKKEDYTPDKVLYMNNYKRGLLWRNDDLSLKQRQENISRLLDYLGLIKNI